VNALVKPPRKRLSHARQQSASNKRSTILALFCTVVDRQKRVQHGYWLIWLLTEPAIILADVSPTCWLSCVQPLLNPRISSTDKGMSCLASHAADFVTSSSGVHGAKYCHECLPVCLFVCLFICFCLFVCLSARISRKPHGRTLPNIFVFYLWP